jgi:hypothetical protein
VVDNNVPKLQPRDPELARIQNNLANTLQGVLDKQSGAAAGTATLAPVMQQVRGRGTPYTVKVPALKISGRPDGPFVPSQPTIVWGDAKRTSATGVVTPQRDVELFSYGQAVFFGSAVTTDGFILIPQVAGSAFRIAPNNASTCFQVNFDGSTTCAGPVTAPSVVSAAGFKCWLPPLSYWNPGYTGGSQFMVLPLAQANGTASTTPWVFPCVRPGSLTGISVSHAGVFALTCSVSVYKNGQVLYSGNVTSGSATGYIAFTKGAYPFLSGDVLTCLILYSANGNVCTQVYLEVEEGA